MLVQLDEGISSTREVVAFHREENGNFKIIWIVSMIFSSRYKRVHDYEYSKCHLSNSLGGEGCSSFYFMAVT